MPDSSGIFSVSKVSLEYLLSRLLFITYVQKETSECLPRESLYSEPIHMLCDRRWIENQNVRRSSTCLQTGTGWHVMASYHGVKLGHSPLAYIHQIITEICVSHMQSSSLGTIGKRFCWIKWESALNRNSCLKVHRSRDGSRLKIAQVQGFLPTGDFLTSSLSPKCSLWNRGTPRTEFPGGGHLQLLWERRNHASQGTVLVPAETLVWFQARYCHLVCTCKTIISFLPTG